MTQSEKKLKLGRLTKRSEFLHVRDGIYKPSGGVVVQMRANPAIGCEKKPEISIRVGFTATKRVGNAVIRNRAKRRLREVARTLLPDHGLLGYDYVFIARDSTLSRPYEQLLDDTQKALLSLSRKAQTVPI
ncbi:MAG: ribonuclease P protein component [Maricaulaceae bacterium]